MAPTPIKPPKPPKTLKLVGLGSSFAAGPGLLPLTNTPAARSSVNYINLLARLLSTPTTNVEVTDHSISGATLLTILSDNQICSGVPFPPQIEGIPEDSDIVTLTGGGNDLRYIGGMARAAIPQTPYLGGILSLAARLSGTLPPDDPLPTPEEITQRFIAIIDAIHTRCPKARIILITYLTLLGSHATPSTVSLTSIQIEELRKVGETLRACYLEASKRRKGICELLDVSEGSWDHGIGSEEPYMAGWEVGMLWRGQAPFHPNYKGHGYIAERLREVIERGA